MDNFSKILAFQNTMPYLNRKEQEELCKMLGIDYNKSLKRLKGIEKEYEFISIIIFLRKCRNMISFDEGICKLFNHETLDFIVELNSGEDICLEVKSTEKNEFKISKSTLDKKIRFSEKLGKKLYFAIHMESSWHLFDQEYMKCKNGKINSNDFKNSLMDSLFDIKRYLFPAGIIARSIYSKHGKNCFEIQIPELGYLQTYELIFNDKVIFKANANNENQMALVLLLEVLNEKMVDSGQQIYEDNNKEYQVLHALGKEHIISEYEFILAIIDSSVVKDFDKVSFYEYIEEMKKSEIRHNETTNVGQIRDAIKFLKDRGIPVIDCSEIKIPSSNTMISDMPVFG